MLRTPILFLVFNRPKETAVVFEAIRRAKPKQLFIAADGSRANRPDDIDSSAAVREVCQKVDWDCEVKTLYRDQNLGCRNAVSSGITWFFENVEQGIVLEDDCLPHPDFFTYCETLLDKYCDDESVMHIGGNNFQDGQKRSDGSYYFSKIPHIWGWASWRRAWQKYDVNMPALDKFIAEKSKQISFKTTAERAYWMQTFKRVKRGEINTWDYQWTFALLNNNGMAITPEVNLVENIGFGESATHTGNSNDRLGQLQTTGIIPLFHPTHIAVNHDADFYWYKKVIPWQLKLKNAVNFLLKK